MERLLNHYGIKAFFREQKVRIGRHVLADVEEQVKDMLQKAIARAQHNKRKTVFGGDI